MRDGAPLNRRAPFAQLEARLCVDTLQSTIVVDDGSMDRTAQVVRRSVSKGFAVVFTVTQGLSAQNHAFQFSQGD